MLCILELKNMIGFVMQKDYQVQKGLYILLLHSDTSSIKLLLECEAFKEIAKNAIK